MGLYLGEYSNVSRSTNDEEENLEDKMTSTLLPVVILISIYMVIGLIGNFITAYY